MNGFEDILQLVVLTGAAITGLYIIARALRRAARSTLRAVRGGIELKRRFDLVYDTVTSEMHPNCGGSMKDLIESFVERFELIESQLAQLIVSDDVVTARRDSPGDSERLGSSPAATEIA